MIKRPMPEWVTPLDSQILTFETLNKFGIRADKSLSYVTALRDLGVVLLDQDSIERTSPVFTNTPDGLESAKQLTLDCLSSVIGLTRPTALEVLEGFNRRGLRAQIFTEEFVRKFNHA